MKTRIQIRGPRAGAALVAAGFAAAALACAGPLPAQSPVSAPEDRKSAQIEIGKEELRRHYEMQQLISREEADWASDRDIMGSRIEFVRAQAEDLKARTSESEASITEADAEREKLLAQDADLDKVEELQFAAAEEFENRVRRLAPLFPEVLRSKIDGLIKRLPEPDTAREDVKLTISQRFQNILGILNEVNRFNRDITVVAERRKMDDGREAEVQTMYIGLAQAYYAGSGETAGVAGTGVPGEQGWQWESRPEEADAIGRLMRMHAGELPAEFVAEPVRIK